MALVELKRMARARGLSTCGRKVELIKRLSEASREFEPPAAPLKPPESRLRAGSESDTLKLGVRFDGSSIQGQQQVLEPQRTRSGFDEIDLSGDHIRHEDFTELDSDCCGSGVTLPEGEELSRTLRSVFGHAGFRPGQRWAVQRVLAVPFFFVFLGVYS